MNYENQKASEYLDTKGIEYKRRGSELSTNCLFNGCDDDSRPNEHHLYLDDTTGQYHCKKCDASGNLVTLKKHLGDWQIPTKPRGTNPLKAPNKDDVDLMHQNLPNYCRMWLNERSIDDDFIDIFKLGYGEFYGKKWITIPVYGANDDLLFLKLRRDPAIEDGDKYMVYPGGSSALFNAKWVIDEDEILITEGEFDCILASQWGIPAITSTAGASTFKDEWLAQLENTSKIYICLDNDKPGKDGTRKLVDRIHAKYPEKTVYNIALPDTVGEGGDLTDYFTRLNGNPDELLGDLAEHVAGRKPIDTSQMQPMEPGDVIEILGQTIKKDDDNKLFTFLALLSAYTEDSQLNLSFNAPSSSGKSFIPMEVATLFPRTDVRKLGYCSPAAFFHDHGKFDEEKQQYTVDLERKILIFQDMPHAKLLEHLRPLLSHDEKEMQVMITDKKQRYGLRTKKIVLRGFPTVVFCSASLRIDEQEQTRFIILSPEVNQNKLGASVMETLERETDKEAYLQKLTSDPKRQRLMDRILAIKQANVKDIRVPQKEQLQDWFTNHVKQLKPRHMRDIKRLVGLAKIMALLNWQWREFDGQTLIAGDQDVEFAIDLWKRISLPQELGVSKYALDFYVDILMPYINIYTDSNVTSIDSSDFTKISNGVTRQEVLKKHYEVRGHTVNSNYLRQELLPMLESAGLIAQESSSKDKRAKLIYPLRADVGNNSETTGGGISNKLDVDLDEIFPPEPSKT